METQKQRLLNYLGSNPGGATLPEISKFLYGKDDPRTLAKTRVAISRANVGGKVKRVYNSPTYGVTGDPNLDSKPGPSE